MNTVLWIVVFLGTFLIMEGMAWFTHKYIMHGFLWKLHQDHHKKDHSSWWERNDLFFVFLRTGEHWLLPRLEICRFLVRPANWPGNPCIRDHLFYRS